jgi:chromosome segregation ATPase
MRVREKIFLLLAGISMILGASIFIHFQDNEVEANYFRWLLANLFKYGSSSPTRFLAEELPSGALLYGGMSLFALVILVVVLKMLRDGELLALRNRLMEILAAKSQTESLLQEEVWKGKHERQAKDYVTRDLEASIERIEKLIGELDDKEKLLKARDVELMSLKMRAVEHQDPASSWDTAGRSLRAELKKQAENVAASESTIKELQARFSAKTTLWESQLREKDALLKQRDVEITELRTEVEDLSSRFDEMEASKKRAEHLLAQELQLKKTLLEANELAARTEEKRLRERMRELEAQLGDKEKLLRGRDTEINAIRRQLAELTSAKADLESRLRDELGSADQSLHATEALIQETEQKYGAAIGKLENEVAEKDLLIQVRDNELKALKAEVKAVHSRLTEINTAKERAEASLHEELRRERQRRLEYEAENSELERRTAREIESAHKQASEKDAILKSRDGEIQSLKAQMASLAEQLANAEITKERAVGSLEKEVRKQDEFRRASDSAIKALEDKFKAKISLLEKQLSEKQRSAGTQDSAETTALRAEILSLNRRLGDLAAAKDNAETLLQEALREKDELARAKVAEQKNLEATFSGKLRSVENQVREQTKLLRDRDSELLAVKNQIAELSAAKEESARSLQEAIKRNTDMLQEKDAALRTVETRFNETVRSLENQLRDKEELLESRDAELKAIGAKVGNLTAQLAEFGRAKDQDARLLREELRQRSELLQVRESALKKQEERFTEQIQALEKQLAEKLNLLETRDSEIDTLMAKVSELTQERAELATEREKAERLAREELREKSALLQAKESSIGEVEEQLNAKIQSLERQLMEKHKLLESSGTELGELRSQVYMLSERLGEAEGAKHHAEALLHEERNKAAEQQFADEAAPQDVARQELNRDADMDRLVTERDQLLKARDKLIQDLMNELKEKKAALARHEIEVWQGIERREGWKRRLSKVGIRLKD